MHGYGSFNKSTNICHNNYETSKSYEVCEYVQFWLHSSLCNHMDLFAYKAQFPLTFRVMIRMYVEVRVELAYLAMVVHS